MSLFDPADISFMTRALELARRGLNTTAPNPRVGCVIVRNGQIVGEAWHHKAGQPHAEALALQQAGGLAAGATAYVTLEPCSHYGRTPPCALALIQAGVHKVRVAMQDPNPLVSGRGLMYLAQAGMDVRSGLLEPEAQELNRGFISRMQRRRPWVRLKLAASIDGRTALSDGRSQWITGDAARGDVQHWRARSCAILTGVDTVLYDDPQLTVRDIDIHRMPLRVIVDTRLRTPPDAKIVGNGTLVATAEHDQSRHQPFLARGAEVWLAPQLNGYVDLGALLHELASREINELHVEAGATLCGAFIQAQLVDEIVLYFAPTIMGDQARAMFNLPALADLQNMHRWHWHDQNLIGQDLRVVLRANSESIPK